ncbi:MAG: hypothetical protein Q8R31_04545 [Candidatus Omnitrophota bacterium]|nr:hypothetical protein [Candidatus Omnitrophota bacterium]
MKIVLDPKQLEMIQQMLDRIAKVAQEIQLEMKRANDLKEKDLKDKEA